MQAVLDPFRVEMPTECQLMWELWARHRPEPPGLPFDTPEPLQFFSSWTILITLWGSFPKSGMYRTLIGIILVLAVFAGLGGLAWFVVHERIRSRPEYFLIANKIIVSPSIPDWIPDRFAEDVLQSSGLSRTGSLLDKTLPQQLADAFRACPWVEKVEQVVLHYPSGAQIKLVYRVPVALVEVPRLGVFPVDRGGVLLPAEYLSNAREDRRDTHLVIQGIQSTPLGSPGTPWGDPLVHTAAQLAAVLTDIAEPLKLVRIFPVMETIPSGARIVCRLRTAAGTEILWGTAVPDDPKIDAKKKRLWDLNERFRSLDNIPAQFQPIDLSRE